jgi:hypothetical protein
LNTIPRRGTRVDKLEIRLRFKFTRLHNSEFDRYPNLMSSSDNKTIAVQWDQVADPNAEAIRRVFRVLLKEPENVAGDKNLTDRPGTATQ